MACATGRGRAAKSLNRKSSMRQKSGLAESRPAPGNGQAPRHEQQNGIFA
jgi:hypothetical protein